MKTQFEQQDYDDMRNDPNNYKWGIFYFNPNDPRVFVPKKYIGTGWTLNFANPYAYLVLIGIFMFAAIMGNIGRFIK